jgi:putative PIN family toxin of toxin-antitoxin system
LRKVVLDTNVLLVSISERSKLHWVFKKLVGKQYELCVSTDILNEYAEIIEGHMGNGVSESTMGVLENLSNVHFITKYYQFHLLKDEDDNKFVDCAIAANADFIVSHDRDFDILKAVKFPRVKVIKTEEFEKVLAEPGKS